MSIDWTYLKLKDSLKKNTTTIYDAFSKNYDSKKTEAERVRKKVKDYEQAFTSEYIGWHSEIKFRAENMFGGRKIYTADVYFNEELTKCISRFVKE